MYQIPMKVAQHITGSLVRLAEYSQFGEWFYSGSEKTLP